MACGRKRTEYEEILDEVCRKHPSAGILYLNYLVRNADNEGFVPSFSVALSNGYEIEDLRVLERAGLTITPDPRTGITVLTYWNFVCEIKPCRRKKTIHLYEKSLLSLVRKKWCKKTEQSSVQNPVQKSVQKSVQKKVQKNGAKLYQNEKEEVDACDSSDIVCVCANKDSNSIAYIDSNAYAESNAIDIHQTTVAKPSDNKSNIHPITPQGVVGEETKKITKKHEAASDLFAPRYGMPESKSRQLLLSMEPQQQRWFEEFWKLYPKSLDAPCTIRAWKKARVNEVLFNEIMTAVRQYCGVGYVMDGKAKNSATWLNACAWQNKAESYSGRPPDKPRVTREEYEERMQKQEAEMQRLFDEETERIYGKQ